MAIVTPIVAEVSEVSRHVEAVRSRRSVSYDYEKVFWNGLYGTGIAGLIYVSMWLGKGIRTLQDPVKSADIMHYNILKSYIEGEHKGESIPPVDILGRLFGFLPWMLPYEIISNWGLGAEIDRYRADAESWAALKAEMEPKENVADKVLDTVDGFYTKYGAALPLGIVGGHALLEYFRVRRMRKEAEAT